MSKWLMAGTLLMAAGSAPAALAQQSGDVIEVALSGAQEDPTVITNGRGRAIFRISGNTIAYTLRYQQLESDIQQAHIHIGANDTTGGIAVFLCSDLGNGPPGTRRCPSAPAQFSGVIDRTDVIGPEAQGVTPGTINDVIRALRTGLAYVNVHTVVSPSGEIRGDVRPHRH